MVVAEWFLFYNYRNKLHVFGGRLISRKAWCDPPPRDDVCNIKFPICTYVSWFQNRAKEVIPVDVVFDSPAETFPI